MRTVVCLAGAAILFVPSRPMRPHRDEGRTPLSWATSARTAVLRLTASVTTLRTPVDWLAALTLPGAGGVWLRPVTQGVRDADWRIGREILVQVVPGSPRAPDDGRGGMRFKIPLAGFCAAGRGAVRRVLARPSPVLAQGVFTILRDWYNNRAGRDDPKAMDKFEHGEKVIETQKRIAMPRRQVRHYGQVDGR